MARTMTTRTSTRYAKAYPDINAVKYIHNMILQYQDEISDFKDKKAEFKAAMKSLSTRSMDGQFMKNIAVCDKQIALREKRIQDLRKTLKDYSRMYGY